MLDDTDHYTAAMQDVLGPYRAFRPPKRVSVSEGAAQNLIFKTTGGPAAPWSPDGIEYMVEPMDLLASRRHEAVAFIGPARCGKTAGLVMGFMAHAVVNDPGDMLVIHMDREKAREFSRTDVDRALRNSPNLAALQSPSKQDDNTHDKMFVHGMWLRIAWPTVPNVSGSTYRYAISTDYDRVDDDIGGEGALFPLLVKRTTTFMSRGMAAVETSPGRDLKDPKWKGGTPHEAPPVGGGLGIYNMGDRRRWYWACPDCHGRFEAAPGMGLFSLPPDDQLLQMVRTDDLEKLAAHYNRVICPACGSMIEPRWKKMLNKGGTWLREGQTFGENDGTHSTIASYWLGGVAAAYQTWKSLLMRNFQALRQYEISGDEQALKNTVNVDQGMPYMPRHLVEAAKASSDPRDRREACFERYVVPEWARFVVVTVDVQGGANARFECQAHAHGPRGRKALVNRWSIIDSNREGMGGPAPIDPASYAEDWDVLTEQVVRSTYRTPIEGRELKVLLTVVDTGGEHKKKGDGVSDKAYAWYRRLRKERLHGRVMLVKGLQNGLQGTPIKETWVGNRGGREKGDVPLYLLDTNRLKDMVDKSMRRTEPGPGYTHLPEWLPDAWFDELNAEVRAASGKWEQIRKRNETLDLLAYDEAGYLRLGADKIIDWDNAPPWAQPLATNRELITREERREMKANEPVAPLASEAVARPVRTRRVARSGYLG